MELQQHLKEPQGRILTVLHELRKLGYVELKEGVWNKVREERK
jgi:hypothetical protein